MGTHGTAVHGAVFCLLLGDTARLVHPAPSCRECGGTSCSMWCSRGQSAPIDTPLVAGDQIGGLLQRCSEMDQVMSEATAELDAMRCERDELEHTLRMLRCQLNGEPVAANITDTTIDCNHRQWLSHGDKNFRSHVNGFERPAPAANPISSQSVDLAGAALDRDIRQSMGAMSPTAEGSMLLAKGKMKNCGFFEELGKPVIAFEHNALDKSGSSTADAKDVTNELGLWNRLFGCQEVNPPE